MTRWRLNAVLVPILLLFLLVLPSSAAQGPGNETRPLILIFCQKQPRYGEELARLLSEDPRIDAEILVLTSPDLFKTMLYFPYVKIVVTAFNQEQDGGLGPHLENFFSNGGGIIGMGYAGCRTTTGNASESIFALNASYCQTGRYDPHRKRFRQILHVDELHEINDGVGDYTALTKSVIMRLNITSNKLLPMTPQGETTVLYRETVHGAPAVVVHKGSGVSVTFACFAADDFERGPTYFGHFTQQEEFRKLFTNSVYWAWQNEHRFEDTLAWAYEKLSDEKTVIAAMRERAEQSKHREGNLWLLRSGIILVLAALAIAGVYHTCLSNTSHREAK